MYDSNDPNAGGLSFASPSNSAVVAPALITLTVPAVPEFVGTVRLAVLGIAGRMGFTYDEVEDIRLAVGEACTNAIARIQHSDARSFTITIRAHVEPTTLTVEVEDNIGIPGGGGASERNADGEGSSDSNLLASGQNGSGTGSGMAFGGVEVGTLTAEALLEMDGDDSDGQELGALLMEILVDEVAFETTPQGVCVRLLKRVTTRGGSSASSGQRTGMDSEL